MLAVGVLGWVGIFRLTRGHILSIGEREFYLAAVAIGNSPVHLVMKHLIPNALSSVIVATTLRTAAAILLESTLSLLGFRVQRPQVSWGNMLYTAQSLTVITTYPWLWIPLGL